MRTLAAAPLGIFRQALSILFLTCAFVLQAQGQSHAIPGTIQAEDYALGGAGIAFGDSTFGNTGGAYRTDDVDIESGTGANGYNVGWIETNEWLAFSVNVSTSATYQVRFAVASAQSGPFTIRLSVDGQPAALVSFNGTGGWQNWMNVSSPTVFALTSGPHTVRLDFLSREFNVDEFAFTILQTATNVPPYKDPNQPLDVRLDDLMARMSLDEKVGQMCQAGKGFLSAASDVRDYRLGSLLSGGGEGPAVNTPVAWADMIDAYQALALSTPLQIPILYGVDAVHGHNNVYGATIFPHNIGLGATRNPNLMERAAQVTAAEVAATGAHWTFAPTMAVARHEAWGRTYESLSEVPDLVAELSAAAIRGYQGTMAARPPTSSPPPNTLPETAAPSEATTKATPSSMKRPSAQSMCPPMRLRSRRGSRRSWSPTPVGTA